MIEVVKDGFTEPLNTYQNLIIDEEVSGNFTLSFTSVQSDNNPAHDLIEEECVINVSGYDFRAKQIKESRGRKEVVAISSFYDLIGTRKDEIFGGTRTFEQFADFIFKDTGWTYTSEVSGSVFIANFGDDNVIKLNAGLCYAFECEFKIMPNKHVHFSEYIGPDNDAQYRYGHNVKALSKSVDTTNLRTKIKGYGADNLVVTYTSPNAVIFGEIEAEPISDDRFTIGGNLVEHIKKVLIDYPEVTLEMDTVELTNKELGERVWLIYEPLNIEFQTRVLSKKSTMRNGELVTTSVILGNTLPKTLGDILASQKVEIDENKKQVMSRIEQTNDRITLEVEEVNSSIAGLEITVGEVELYVEELDESIATVNLKADSISLSVSNLSNRVGNAESQINIQAGQISSKVSTTDYNGERLVSMINQTPSSVKIQAKNITLAGAVTVLSELSGNLGNIYAGNIDISQAVKVGDEITLNTFGSQRLVFGHASDAFGRSTIRNSSGTLNIYGPSGIQLDGATLGVSFTGSGAINFNNRTVNGLNGYARAHTSGLGLAYNGNDRIYFRINGSDVGYITISK